AAMPSMTEVKNLFGMMLDAAAPGAPDPGGDSVSAAVQAAKAAFDAAPPALRAAVEKLLEAHRRASGVLLEGAVPAEPSVETVALTPVALPRIPGYEIGQEIGRGGFGVVYRAQQLHPVERAVAVKVLRTELAT